MGTDRYESRKFPTPIAQTAQRTAGAWKVVSGSPYKGGSVNIVNQQGDYVALVGHKQNCDADAKFIVCACNAHDELVAALRSIADTDYNSVRVARSIARAALAKVTP